MPEPSEYAGHPGRWSTTNLPGPRLAEFASGHRRSLQELRRRPDRRRPAARCLTPRPARRPPHVTAHRHDVLVVGGGPAGVGRRLLAGQGRPRRGGRREEAFPREKTCGDGLTPRAVHQLDDMGLADELDAATTATTGCGPWPTAAPSRCAGPSTRSSPSHGYVVRRRDLDKFVAENAVAAGATLRQGTEAIAPVLRDGLVVGRRSVKDKATGGAVDRGDPRPLRGRRRRGQLRASAGPWARPATGPIPRAWPSAATTRARCTPSRGSSPPSTCATATARRCPATAGSSRWATARSTSASACCRRSATTSRSTPST